MELTGRSAATAITLGGKAGATITYTSINDSTHVKGSRHYTNEALDLRSKNFRREHKPLFREHLQSRLGPQFTVLLEHEGGTDEHYHVQVKRGTTYTV